MGDQEATDTVYRKALPAPGTIISGSLGDEVQTIRRSTPASGGVAWSGDTPVMTWRQKIHPSSGGGKAVSGGAGAETWGAWVNVVTPAQEFEVVKIEAQLKQKDAYYMEFGKSGQSDTDIAHLECLDSGSVIVHSLNSPKRYGSGDDVSIRTKSQRGSGIESTIWIITREPT